MDFPENAVNQPELEPPSLDAMNGGCVQTVFGDSTKPFNPDNAISTGTAAESEMDWQGTIPEEDWRPDPVEDDWHPDPVELEERKKAVDLEYNRLFSLAMDRFINRQDQTLDDLVERVDELVADLQYHHDQKPSSIVDGITAGYATRTWEKKTVAIELNIHQAMQEVDSQKEYMGSHLMHADATLYARQAVIRENKDVAFHHDERDEVETLIRERSPVEVYSIMMDKMVLQAYVHLASQKRLHEYQVNDIQLEIGKHHDAKPGLLYDFVGKGEPMARWQTRLQDLQNDYKEQTKFLNEVNDKRQMAPDSEAIMHEAHDLLRAYYPKVVENYEIALKNQWEQANTHRLEEMNQSVGKNPEMSSEKETALTR